MTVSNPSIVSIAQALDSRYRLHAKIYPLIWSYMRACNDIAGDLSPEKSHKLIDELLGNHGVESFRVKVAGQVRTLYYSNTGDTYNTTVCRWDWIDGGQRRVIWFIGNWGDIAEKYPEA